MRRRRRAVVVTAAIGTLVMAVVASLVAAMSFLFLVSSRPPTYPCPTTEEPGQVCEAWLGQVVDADNADLGFPRVLEVVPSEGELTVPPEGSDPTAIAMPDGDVHVGVVPVVAFDPVAEIGDCVHVVWDARGAWVWAETVACPDRR